MMQFLPVDMLMEKIHKDAPIIAMKLYSEENKHISVPLYPIEVKLSVTIIAN